jgi:hypothetical protein
MFQKGGLKNLQTFFFVLLAAGFALPILFYVHNQTSTPTDALKDSSFTRHAATRHPEPRHKIDGFGYQGSSNGQTVISIKADSFSLQKKKIGFFRFGLLNEARLDNAVVHIYGNVRSAQAAADGVPNKPGRILTFNNLFKKDFIKESTFGLPLKRISAILMKPASVVLHDEQSVVTRIAASSAVIRLKQQDIIFKGNVRAVSGPAILTTERLVMIPETAVLKTDEHFVLKTPAKQREGQHLTTDVFLNSVKL